MSNNTHAIARRWIGVAVKLLVVALVVWFVRRTLFDAWHDLNQQPLQIDWRWLVVCGALYLLGTLFCGLFWHRVLRSLGQPIGLGVALAAYYVGHLGKYVPGKAMVMVIRAGLVRSPQVDTALAAVSVFFETMTMMSSGAMMAAVIVAVWFHQHGLLLATAVLTAVGAGLPTLPPVFRRLVRLVGIGGRSSETVANLKGLGYKTMFLGWGLNWVGWLILGMSYWAALCSLNAVEINPGGHIHLYVAAVTLATVAGFVSFVPGGAVVREAVLTQLMAPFIGGAAALAAAILLRVVWLVSELLISGILYCARPTPRSRQLS